LRTALALIAPRPLLVHNAHPNLPRKWAEGAYRAANAMQKFSWNKQAMGIGQLVNWLASKI